MSRIPIVHRVLARNESAATENRNALDAAGTLAVNVLGSAGCGKTALLEGLIPHLRPILRIGVLEGDLATTQDARRIAALDVPVVQLLTDGGCHLNAPLVQQGLRRLPLADLHLVIIENVGNPVCPANFDLGEHCRIAVLSVTEGDDKPLKYPLMFRRADAVVITKCDLLPMVDFQLAAVREHLRQLCPRAPVLLTSAVKDAGFEELAAFLIDRLPASARGTRTQPIATSTGRFPAAP